MSESDRLIAKRFMPPPSMIRAWFDDALKRDDPHPSADALGQLARSIQIIANRHNNTFIEQEFLQNYKMLPSLPTGNMADVSPVEWEQKKLESVAFRAGKILAGIQELRQALDSVEEFSGDYNWNDALSISELRVALSEITPWLFGIGGDAAVWREREQINRGRPKSAWHLTGEKIGIIVKATLEESGYTRKLSLKNEESAAAIISTCAVNWAFDISIEPSGFATAMRSRKRGGKSE